MSQYVIILKIVINVHKSFQKPYIKGALNSAILKTFALANLIY